MSPGTPHKNGVVERVFATLYSQMRVMMAHAGLHENLNTGLCSKCTATTTKSENIMVKPHEEKCAHKNFYEKIREYAKYLRNFGEMGFVRSIATVKEKPENLGKTCMFLDYAKNHTGGKYRMLNLRSKRILLSHDVIWINKTQGEYISRK